MTKREDLRLQGDTGLKTGGDQSEKGNKKRAHRDTTRISRMLGTTAFSARTEFSVTTGCAVSAFDDDSSHFCINESKRHHRPLSHI
jgi:hypothetical protein